MIQTPSKKDYYRYCPGEESVKISNAICRGRRRVHFPKCAGCQFNDDEKAAALQPGGAPPAPLPFFPVRVANGHTIDVTGDETSIASLFHSDNIVGTTPEPLSDQAAWRIGHATGQFLRSKLRGYDRADPNARSVIIGRDTRASSPQVEHSVIEGIRSTGTDVFTLGEIGLPLLYFAVNHIGACGGVLVSAGHRPLAENGLRVCGGKALPIHMETGMASIRDIAVRIPYHQSGSPSRRIPKDLGTAYAGFVRNFLLSKVKVPRLLKVVVDASNGTGGKWVPAILRGIRNLRLTRVNFETKGEFAHEPNPLQAKNLRDARTALRTESADVAVCFDAAEERCVVIDDKGHIVRPEYVVALLARQFIEREPGAMIVLDHRASVAAEEEITRAGGVVVRERIGGPHMKRCMSERNAVFGGDISGRFYFRDNYFAESAAMTLVQLINLLSTAGKSLSELVRPMNRYSNSGELRYQCEDAGRVIREVARSFEGAQIEHFDGVTVRYPDWWFNVLPHAAERQVRLTLEARSRKLVEEKLAHLEPMLGQKM